MNKEPFVNEKKDHKKLIENFKNDSLSGALARRISARVFADNGFIIVKSETEGYVDRVFFDGKRDTGRFENGVFVVLANTNL